jgi:hypothetical protein
LTVGFAQNPAVNARTIIAELGLDWEAWTWNSTIVKGASPDIRPHYMDREVSYDEDGARK